MSILVFLIMRNYKSLRYVKDNCPSVWSFMCEHDCTIKMFGKTIYEGKMSEGVYLRYLSEVMSEMITVECAMDEDNIMLLTMEDNTYIDEVKSLGDYDIILNDSKKYSKAVNMCMMIPTIGAFTNIEDKIKYVLMEDDESMSNDEGQSMGGDDNRSLEGDNSAALGQDSAKEDEENKKRSDIKFKIFTAPDKMVDDLKKGEKYLKIEYVYTDKKKGIQIDFLIGRKNEEKDWNLYIGKIGSTSYDDDPYKSLETKDLTKAINNAVDEAMNLIKEVEENRDGWLQFYDKK